MHKYLKGLIVMQVLSPDVKNTDNFRDKLTFFLAGSFVTIIPLFIFWGMPSTSENIVTYMVGQLSGMATMALGYYFTRSNPNGGPLPVEVTNTTDNPAPVKEVKNGDRD